MTDTTTNQAADAAADAATTTATTQTTAKAKTMSDVLANGRAQYRVGLDLPAGFELLKALSGCPDFHALTPTQRVFFGVEYDADTSEWAVTEAYDWTPDSKIYVSLVTRRAPAGQVGNVTHALLIGPSITAADLEASPAGREMIRDIVDAKINQETSRIARLTVAKGEDSRNLTVQEHQDAVASWPLTADAIAASSGNGGSGVKAYNDLFKAASAQFGSALKSKGIANWTAANFTAQRARDCIQSAAYASANHAKMEAAGLFTAFARNMIALIAASGQPTTAVESWLENRATYVPNAEADAEISADALAGLDLSALTLDAPAA